MLFLLTGNIQTGKSRWLMRTISALEERGVAVSGVLTPGVWRHRCPQEMARAGASDGKGEFEKLGIDAILLPQRERLSFARPAPWFAPPAEGGGAEERQACNAPGEGQGVNQSRKAQLGWDISEDALAAINAHFDALRERAASEAMRGLVVIDELGRLELCGNGGLTSALRMVDEGPTEAFPHILAVVREELIDLAHQRFSEAWHDGMADIYPDGASAQLLFDALAPHHRAQ